MEFIWDTCAMGTFRVPIEIGKVEDGGFERVEALVDAGATYTLLPREVLERLGVRPHRDRRFILADGREVSYPTAWVIARIDGEAQPTIVIFGEPGCDPLLGAVTLEEFGLAADPVGRRLVPVPGLLK